MLFAEFMKDKILFGLFGFAIICLFLYSYTQVDLNLTLSQNGFILSFQRFFQHIGFFERQMSTILYVLIMTLLFILYFIFLRSVKKGHMSGRQIWTLIIFSAIILNFSYNAFSYDLFNYIFDAKIITHYHLNPYIHRALDFPGDPMLLFMHWTHRLYPYGPSWLGLTVPLSYIGLGFFLPTLFLFKTMTTAFFLGTVYFIGKILKRVGSTDQNLGVLFFGLNPLVISEVLVSSHNDMSMMFFAVLSFYLLLNRKNLWSFVSLLVSVGVKFATAFLFPVWFYLIRSKKPDFEKAFFMSFILMGIAVLVATFRTSFQPWYYFYVLPFISLTLKKYNLFWVGILISILALLDYIPFLYFGNWNSPAPAVIFWTTAAGFVGSLILIIKPRVLK